jgi:6-pyruvoyltetrahydropterin/6-carboxytetrahydropterin synthase
MFFYGPMEGGKDFYMYYLTAEAAFDSAHFLCGHGGKCANLHGHRWRIIAKIAGATLQEEGEKAGMLLDFSDFKREVHGLADSLDHRLLIERGTLRLETLDALEGEGFEVITLSFRPTAENLAKYLFDSMKELGFPIHSMTVYETPDNCAIYEDHGE